MTTNNFDPKAAYGVIKMIFIAILSGPIIFLFIALYITEGASSSAFDLEEPLNLALIILTFMAIPLGSVVSRRVFSSVKPEDDARKRMTAFQTGWIIRLASYEGVALFSIVVFMITGNILILLFAAVSLLGMITSFPRPSYIRQAVGIKETDLI